MRKSQKPVPNMCHLHSRMVHGTSVSTSSLDFSSRSFVGTHFFSPDIQCWKAKTNPSQLCFFHSYLIATYSLPRFLSQKDSLHRFDTEKYTAFKIIYSHRYLPNTIWLVVNHHNGSRGEIAVFVTVRVPFLRH